MATLVVMAKPVCSPRPMDNAIPDRPPMANHMPEIAFNLAVMNKPTMRRPHMVKVALLTPFLTAEVALILILIVLVCPN